MTASDEAKKALEGVTPGPWKTGQSSWNDEGDVQYVLHGIKHAGYADCMFIAWAREGVPALLAEIASKDAEIARLRSEFSNATDENFVWGAMDNVHDAETTLDDYAAAVSRAQRAAIARVKGGEA